VHRSDSSGTSYIFTNYLSQVSQQWSTQVGVATSVNWPGDVGGSGTAGVAADVQQIGGLSAISSWHMRSKQYYCGPDAKLLR